MDVRASKRAVRYIRARGGVLYVWTDGRGLLQHATQQPADLESRRFRAPGFALFVQKGLNLGEWMRVERSLFPPWGLSIGFGSMGHAGGEGGAAY